jgi:hypothetical protein
VDLTLLRKPSACLPIAMSVAALALVAGALALHGISQAGGDEGAAAHTWQLLGYFAWKWLRRAPRQALLILALQGAAAVAALAPVYLLHL